MLLSYRVLCKVRQYDAIIKNIQFLILCQIMQQRITGKKCNCCYKLQWATPVQTRTLTPRDLADFVHYIFTVPIHKCFMVHCLTGTAVMILCGEIMCNMVIKYIRYWATMTGFQPKITIVSFKLEWCHTQTNFSHIICCGNDLACILLMNVTY